MKTNGLLRRIGWGTMLASLGLWALIPLLPFLPISGSQRLASAGGILVAAEIVFWIGAALAGPDAVRRMRSWWRSRSLEEAQRIEAKGLHPPK